MDDSVVQRALDALREFAAKDLPEHGAYLTTVVPPSRYLREYGFNAADTSSIYETLKRLGLIKTIKKGRGPIAPTIQIDMLTSVAQRRIERLVSNSKGYKVSGKEALITHYSDLITYHRSEITRLESLIAEVTHEFDESTKELEPT